MRQRITCTMGIDLGDRTSYIHGIDVGSGEVLGRGDVRTTPEALGDLFESLPPLRVVLETGTHAGWVARLAQRHGHEVVVAQARRLRFIYRNPTKCDATDARMLAELGSTHPDLLSPVQMRDARTQAQLSVVRAREAVVQARTKLINASRGFTKSLGHRLPRCSAGSFARRVWDACPRTPQTPPW